MAKDVVEAVAAIMRELPAIGKDESSPEIKYKFRGIETLIGHLNPLMAKHRLIIVPTSTITEINREVENTKGKMTGWTETILRVEWQILGPEGGCVHAATVGIGRDNSDKGSNKAQTQAFKYLLMELFAIGDKDDDGDRYAGTGDDDGQADAGDWWTENGWADKAEHDEAMGTVKAAIAKGDEAAPGFRAEMSARWRELGLRTPMSRAGFETWKLRIDAEFAAFLASSAQAGQG